MTNPRTPKARASKTSTTRKAPPPASPVGPPDLTTVAGRLRYARELRGESTRGLGTAAGLSSAAVHKIEHAPDGGAHVWVETVEALAKVLDVTPQWLAFGIGGKPRSPEDG